MPVAWTKKWGEGRVFYSSLGHKPAEFDEFSCEAWTLTTRGILLGRSSLMKTRRKKADQPLRVGLVGCGKISDAYFRGLEPYSHLVEIVACADLDSGSRSGQGG